VHKFSLLLVVISLVACGVEDPMPTQVHLLEATITPIEIDAQPLATPSVDFTAVAVVITPTDDNPIDNSPTDSPTVDSPTDTPLPCVGDADWSEYTVAAGDNLTKISQRFGSTVDDLTLANCLDDPDRLRVGQVIYVPPNGIESIPPTTSPVSATNVPPTALPIRATNRPPQPTAAPASGIVASLEKTYTHDKGFSFDYPMGWLITESQMPTANTIQITSFQYTNGSEIPQNLWSDDMVSITWTIFEEATEQPLSDWTQVIIQQFQSAANVSAVALPELVRTDGDVYGQLIEYVTSDDVVVRNYYFIINGYAMQVTIGGNVSLAESLIQSLTVGE
jgi:LysM repeat protein